MKSPTTIIFIFFCILPVFLSAAPISAATASPELPTTARVVLSKAHALINDGLYDEALETIENFQARGPERHDPGSRDPRGYHHAEVYFTLGNIHFAQENHQEAKNAYLQALTRDPGHVYSRLNLARIYYEQENYSGSAENFAKAYDTHDQKNPEYLYYAAVSWLIDDSLEPAIDAFERLLDAHPEEIRPEWRENMVHAFLAGDMQEEALLHIKILVDEYEGEKRVRWQEILLYQYIGMNMKDKAEAYALELTRESPTTDKWWKALAHVALSRDNYENALVAMTVYSYLTPLSTEEKKLLADLNLHVGVPAMAVPAYEATMAEKPDRTVLRNLVIAYQQMERHEHALKTIEAFDGHEEDPELMMLKADILYSIKAFGDAGKVYRKAAEIESRHAGRAWLMAGYADWQAGDLTSARKMFEEASTFDSQRKNATSALNQILDLK